MKNSIHFFKNVLMAVALMLFTLVNTVLAQDANVTINNSATANGSWSGGTTGPYVFTPSANGANVLKSDITSRLLGTAGYTRANVTINTACGGCSQSGNITVAGAITAANTTTTSYTLALNAANNIAVDSSINLAGATGATGTAAVAGFPGTAATAGGAGGYGINLSLATTNSVSTITLNSTNSVTINTSGGTGGTGGAGANGQNAGNGGTGGNAGTVILNSGGSVSISSTNSITSNGGAGGAGGAAGGFASTAGTAGATGNGGNMFLTGVTGITLAGNLTSTGTTKGSFTINDGSASVTTGGGINDGQTAGVISGGNLTKIGTGTFFIGGNNTYTGTTTITAGTLRPTNNTVVASTNGPLGNNASGLFLNGGVLESNVATFSRPITVSATNSRIDAYGAARTISSTITLATAGSYTLNVGGTNAASAEGQDLTLSGVISNSSGTLNVTKVGNSMLTISGNNTFGGGTHHTAGTLNINSTTALGDVAGTFIIDSLTTINNTTGGIINTSNYPMIWNGSFYFSGSQPLNLGTGAVTMNADVKITAMANTLTVGGIINNATRSLIKAGGGTVSFGSQSITLNTLNIMSGTIVSTSGNMSLNGNFTNGGTFTHNSGTVTLNGTGTQTVGGNVATTFNNLTVNNTYNTSPQITLTNDETVSGTLTLTSGNVDALTNSKTLFVSNNAAAAISRTSGYVIGNLDRAITNTGSPTYAYYLGTNAGGYTPVSIAFNNLTAGGNLTGVAASGDLSSVCISTINVGLTVNDNWTFTNTGVTFTSYGATFTYPSGDLDAGTTASAFVVGNNSGTWSYPAISGTPTNTSITFTGETTFGSYAIGNTTVNSISYAGNPFCETTSSAQAVTLSGAQGGTYTADAGLTIDTNTGDITPNTSPAGVYSVTYTPAAAVCTGADAVTTVTVNAAPTATITNNTGITLLTCVDTLIQVTASGGGTYSWSGGDSVSTAINTFKAPGTYTVTVTVGGCSDWDAITITQDISTPTVSITNNSGTSTLTCAVSTVSVTAGGGNTYTWDGGLTPNTASNVFDSTNTYRVTVIGNNGCSATDSITITIDTIPPTVGINNLSGSTDLNCNNSSISVLGTGADTYIWTGGSSTNADANSFSTAGTYTVTGTGTNGCTAWDSITITGSTVIAGITNNSGTTIIGCTTATIDVTATGGTSYSWSGGTRTATAQNSFVTAGSYTVIVTDGNGCSDTTSIDITQDTTPPTVSITNNTGTTLLDCNTTSIDVEATGTAATYLWTGGSSTNAAQNLLTAPGDYTVTATAANGCSAADNIVITQDIATPTVSITNNSGTTQIDCSTSSIDVVASGGATYLWTGGNTPNTDANTFISPASYSVTVTGANGCSAVGSIDITQDSSVPTVSITNNSGTTVITCSAPTISLTATGAATYVWSGGSSTNTDINEITVPGTYTVTGTNANGCSGADVITITIDTTSASITNNSGTNNLDCTVLSITATANGGSAYTWSGGNSASAAQNTFDAPGTYTVTVANTNGCNNTAEINITQSAVPPTVSITNNTGTTVLDCNVSSISVTASGAANFTWSGGSSTSTAQNTFNSPGTYTVTGDDGNGCSSTNTITITQDIALPTVGITNNTGTNQLDCNITSINVTATGGNSYVWSGGSSPNTDVNTFSSPAGYTVTATGNNGCSASASINITQSPAVPTISITNNTGSTQINCSTTSISVLATGANTYVWSGGLTPNTDANTLTTAGTYTVIGTNLSNCSATAVITITQNTVAPVVSINNNTGSTQLNCTNSLISVTATGNAANYVWSGGNTPNLNTNTFTSTGTYVLTGSNANGCSNTASITITQNNNPPTITFTNHTGTTQLDCNNDTIYVTANGAASYTWSGGDSLNSAGNTFSAPATYTVTGVGSNGCTNTATITLTQDITPPAAIILQNNTGTSVLDCNVSSISATASGANTFVWSGGTSLNTATNTFSSPGTYTVVGYNANGCSNSSSITLTQNITPPTIGITNNSGGSYTLSNEYPVIDVTATGAASYVWSAGSSTATANNTFAATGTYTVTGTGANGCVSTNTVAIGRISVALSLTGGLNPSCSEDVVAYTFLATPANGIVGTKTYLWKVNGNNVTGNTTSANYSSTTLQNGDVVSVVMTVTNGLALTTSASTTMTISTSPAAPSITQSGNTLMSSSATGNQWYQNGIALSGETSQYLTIPATGGFYYVEVTVNGCTAKSNIYSTATGIEDITQQGGVAIYPNPFSEQATVLVVNDLNNATVKVINALGETVKQYTFTGKQVVIDRENLSAGVYLVQIISDSNVIANAKVIVQ